MPAKHLFTGDARNALRRSDNSVSLFLQIVIHDLDLIENFAWVLVQASGVLLVLFIESDDNRSTYIA